jgi:tRNA pseudouridine32 synthase/23S rRNA pseudouridine746 synthase
MKASFKYVVPPKYSGFIVDYLAVNTGLSKVKIKKCISAGGMWVGKTGKNALKLRRFKKLKHKLSGNEIIELYFDENAFYKIEEYPFILHETSDYGLWYKPVNILSQGSRYGDITSMEYLVKKIKNREVHVVNRLDREASGIMAVAYSSRAAAELGELWRGKGVEKLYQTMVLGVPEPASGIVDKKIEGKAALTEYRTVAQASDTASFVEAKIRTGRRHQIRLHLAAAGCPVMGDPRYGKNNSFKGGLQLVAVSVRFRCPVAGKDIFIEVPPEKRLWAK